MNPVRRLEINSKTLSDGRWHLASIVHQGKTLTCQVDGWKRQLTGFKTGMRGLVFIGGVPNKNHGCLGDGSCNSTVKNFSGCIGDVFLGNRYVDDILRKQHVTQGSSLACDNRASGLMALGGPGSVLIWKIQTLTQPLLSLDLQMRTLERTGFIARISTEEFVLSLSLTKGLVRARLKLSHALDSNTLQVFSTNKVGVADGRWHRVLCFVDMANEELELSIDGGSQIKTQFTKPLTNIKERGIVGTLKIGRFLHEHQYFIGCVREMFINKVLVRPNDWRYVAESKNIVAGSCTINNVGKNANVILSNINVTGSTPNRLWTSTPSSKDDTNSNESKIATPTVSHPNIPSLWPEISYRESKSREIILKSNATGSLGKGKAKNPSLAYLIVIATLVSVLVLLLTCVLIICARLKHCLCFRESCDQLKNRDAGVESAPGEASMRPAENKTVGLVQQHGPPLQVESRNMPAGFQSVNEIYFSMNRQQARYWRERDEKLLDSQCRQHMEAERRIVPPVAQLEATQSPKRRMTTHTGPDVILTVPDKSDPRRKVVPNKGMACKENTRPDDTFYRKDSKLSQGNTFEVKKSKAMEEIPVKKKRRLGYGWAYGSRFARGADSSDTDCSDIERLSSHSKYRYRYGKNSGTVQTGRPLKILEASETEEEQQSNDERSGNGHSRKWGRFGRRKKFGTFGDQRPRVLNVLSEEDRAQDMDKSGGPVAAVGTKLASVQWHQDSPLLPKTCLEKDLACARDRRRSQNYERGRDTYTALPGTSTHPTRGDPDGRPEIPRRLSSLVLPPEDVHGGLCASAKDSVQESPKTLQDYLTFSGVVYDPLHKKCTYDVNDHAKAAAGQDVGRVQLNTDSAAAMAARKQSVTTGSKTPKAGGVPRLHVRVPKEMLMRRADNLISSDRPTIV